jgi:hypothetical protein
MENIKSVDVLIIMGERLLNFGENSCFYNYGRHRTTSTKSNGVSSQDAAGFAHTAVEALSLDK